MSSLIGNQLGTCIAISLDTVSPIGVLSALEKTPPSSWRKVPQSKMQGLAGWSWGWVSAPCHPLSWGLVRGTTIDGGPNNKHSPVLPAGFNCLQHHSWLVHERERCQWAQKSPHGICVYFICSCRAAFLGHFIHGLTQFVGTPRLVYELHRNQGVRHDLTIHRG